LKPAGLTQRLNRRFLHYGYASGGNDGSVVVRRNSRSLCCEMTNLEILGSTVSLQKLKTDI
jgi:hypothetical protein